MSATETLGSTSVLPISEAYPLYCNTPEEDLYSNIQINGNRNLPILERQKKNDAACILVGGGPSLKNDLEGIRARQKSGYVIFALNGAGNYLLENGIIPDHVILLDARPSNIKFVAAHDLKTTFYISSQCHPSIFDYLETRKVTLWHPNMNGKSGYKERMSTVFIGGGTSVGTRALSIVEVLGYRSIHLFGYDSSYEASEGHAYIQEQREEVETVTINGKDFITTPWMIRQASDFVEIAANLASLGCNISVHGTGLLPEVAKQIQESQKPIPRGERPSEVTCFYDLFNSPATYDFVVFLALAEQYRKSMRVKNLKIVVVAGPNNGFRDDLLPPLDPEHRKQMLWGIVLASCRLVPSVSSVVFAANRHEAGLHENGYVFPSKYTVDQPFQYYGFFRLVNGFEGDRYFSCFRAPKDSLDYVDKWISPKTITITLRESTYVTDRNSDLEEWKKAARDLEIMGYRVIFIRDTEKAYEDIEGFETNHVAAYDICVRMALYERSCVNLFVGNGPFTMAVLDDHCKSLTFGVCRENVRTLSSDDWTRRGFPVGSQLRHIYANHRIVWELDKAEYIVREVSDFLGLNFKMVGE